MSRKAYGGDNLNKARTGIKLYGGDPNDIARTVIKGYCGDSSNIARQFWPSGGWSQIGTSPIDGYGGCAVVFEDKIHLFNGTDHFSFDGNTYMDEGTLPGNTEGGACAVVYAGHLHLINNRTGMLGHYDWDGRIWTQRGNPRDAIIYGMNNAVVYGENIITVSSRFGSAGMFRYIYRCGGDEWTRLQLAMPDDLSANSHSCCVFNGNVEYISSENNYTKHLLWDGTIVSSLDSMPYPFTNGMMLEAGGKIHFIGSQAYGAAYGGGDYRRTHYTWDGTNYEELDSLPFNSYNCPAVLYHNKIYLFGCSETNCHNYVAVYEDESWVT